MKIRSICLPITFLIIACLTLNNPANAQESIPKGKKPYFNIPYFSDPETFGLELKWAKELKKAGPELVATGSGITRYDIKFDIDALIPFKYHPEGLVRANLDLSLNWIMRGKSFSIVPRDNDGNPIPGFPAITNQSPYPGALLIDLEAEAARNPATEDWEFKSVNMGLGLKAMIPWTDFDFAAWFIEQNTRVAGTIPITISLIGKAVLQTEPEDSTFARIDFRADWGIPLISGTYFYPKFEASLAENSEVHTYFRGEILKLLRKKNSLGTYDSGKLQPMVLFRYIDGRRAPNYVWESEFYIGAGLELLL